jgi:hypothetical protein
MFVSNISAISSFFCHVALALPRAFGCRFASRVELRSRAGVFRCFGWRVFILASACYAIILTSGCGAGVSGSVEGGLLVSPGILNFGSVSIGHEVDSSVNVTNTTSSPIIISQVNISGQTFSIPSGNNMPVSIPAGSTYALKIGFTPTSTGNYSGQATLLDKLAQPLAQVAIQGQGSSESVPQLNISDASLNFGSVAVNALSTQSLMLTSTGSSPVTVNSVAIAGAGFTIVRSSLPTTLNPNQSIVLQVRFAPTSPGAASGQLTIDSNSLSGNSAVVTLSGTGAITITPQTSPLLTLSASSLSFSNVTANTATAQSLTLTSTGTSPVTVNSAAIAGAGFTLVGGSLPAILNPMQSMTLQVQFAPTSTGLVSGQLTISSDSSSGNTATVALTGTSSAAPSPQLTISTASLSFGSVIVNTAMTQSLTFTSTGSSSLIINSVSIAGAGYSLLGGSLPVTLNPSQSITLPVQFKPTVGGAANGQIMINSNSSSGSTAIVALSGTGTAQPSPQLATGVASLSFGNVTVDTVTSQSLTLTSTGTSPVTVYSASVNGAGYILVGGSLPATLNPTQSMTLQVQFKPTASGAANGQITISSNSSSGSTATVALSGTGVAPPSPQLTVSSVSLGFGNVTVNSTATKSVTLTSTGSSDVTVSAAAISGAGYSIVAQSFPVILSPTQSLTLQVEFKPTAAGASSGQLTISSNSTTGSAALVALSGTGTAANPQLTISASTLSFGNVAVNTAASQTLTLTSTGTTPVTVNSGSIVGADFTFVGGSFPVTLNPNQTLLISLQFKPSMAGAATGQLTLSSNSTTGGTAQVNLSGTGTATSHEVDLSWNAPTNSPDPVANYNIYRSTGGASLVLLNSVLSSSLSYVDSTVTSGSTYTYIVKSVDISGVESDASNEATATIP